MLEVDGISRRFGPVQALDNVSFQVRPGRLTGFVGANGAGKTTAMRVILGILAADAGSVRFNGAPIDLDVRRTFGYMPEERGLYPKMKIAEQVAFLGEIHGLGRSFAKARAARLLEDLGLGDRQNDLLEKLSLGNQQRVQIAAALLHDPTLLILDEPFSGLDPIAVDAMTVQLRDRADKGAPVLFSSHQLDLVERLCDDIVIIDGGKVLAFGDVDELRRIHGKRLYRVEVDATPALAATELQAVPGVIGLQRQGSGEMVLELSDEADEQLVLTAAQRLGPVRAFAPIQPNLAQIFRGAVAR